MEPVEVIKLNHLYELRLSFLLHSSTFTHIDIAILSVRPSVTFQYYIETG